MEQMMLILVNPNDAWWLGGDFLCLKDEQFAHLATYMQQLITENYTLSKTSNSPPILLWKSILNRCLILFVKVCISCSFYMCMQRCFCNKHHSFVFDTATHDLSCRNHWCDFCGLHWYILQISFTFSNDKDGHSLHIVGHRQPVSQKQWYYW